MQPWVQERWERFRGIWDPSDPERRSLVPSRGTSEYQWLNPELCSGGGVYLSGP